jgi:hypothetical protein
MAGIAIATLCPLLIGLGVLLSKVVLPECSAKQTFAACSLLGYNMYGLMEVCFMWGFVGGIFLVPIGVVVLIIGVLIGR